MLIDNPTSACYVGQAAGKDAEPATLQLAIPADFQRVTFDSEFFGRRFFLVGGRLVTGVPWPPGRRELTFSYLLGNTQRHYVWQRPLDLPSAKVRVSICTDRPGQVTCNLGDAPWHENGQIAFESGERTLAVGYPLRVELGSLPVSAMAYAPGRRSRCWPAWSWRLPCLGCGGCGTPAMKTNAMHILDTLGIRYEIREYKVNPDERDLT